MAVERMSFLIQLLAPFLETVSKEILADRRREHLRFQPVLDFIHGNLADQIRVPQLARLIQLEPSYFSRAFRHHFGVPPNAAQPDDLLDHCVKEGWSFIWADSKESAADFCRVYGLTAGQGGVGDASQESETGVVEPVAQSGVVESSDENAAGESAGESAKGQAGSE